jgi:hypothetical protein
MDRLRIAIEGALAIAAVSTLGDYVWATLIPEHRPLFGLAHGTLLLGSVGWWLGAAARQPAPGAVGGALIGLLAAGGFYALAPLTGYSAMFVMWFVLWIALAALDVRVLRRGAGWRETIVRGLAAAIASGLAFYAIAGIWMPFRPRGWDYAVHFGSWTVAYLPAFLALQADWTGWLEARAISAPARR